MITVTPAFNTAMNLNARLWQLKVTIKRNEVGSAQYDISDRITSCSINFDWESRSSSASIQIDNYDYSLSPMNRSSATNLIGGVFDPLLDSNHVLEIWYGLFTTDGYEYIKRFTGVLGDEIDADTYPGTVSLTARDLSKLFQDSYIYQSDAFGNPPVYVEGVMQTLINRLSNHITTVNVPSPTLFDIGTPTLPYIAKDVNLWTACQTLADASNTDLRFDENGTLYLKVINRDLDTVTPVITFYERNLIRDSLSVSDADVRNHIVLRIQGLNPIEMRDLDSIAKYGRRYMEVTRSLANIITNTDQGIKLVQNFLKDLAYATPTDQLQLPLYPMIQIGDVICIDNTKLGTNSTLDIFRVTSISEEYSADSKRTSLTLQGYQKISFANTPTPNPPTTLSGTTFNRIINNYTGSGWSGNTKTTYFPRITWVPPSANTSGGGLAQSFGGYQIYRQGVSDSQYYNIASVQSYIDAISLQTNYFNDYTAGAGDNNYKIVAISNYGKKSTETSSVTVNLPEPTITT